GGAKEAARVCGISPCSIRVTLQPFSERRRAATMPAAPAPMTTTRTLSPFSEGETQSETDENERSEASEPAGETRGAAQHACCRAGRDRNDAVHRRAADIEDEAQDQ